MPDNHHQLLTLTIVLHPVLHPGVEYSSIGYMYSCGLHVPENPNEKIQLKIW
jgi:hypothetical protein